MGKYKYPEAYKLSEREIRDMADIIRESKDMKEVEEQLETYIKENGAKFRQWYGFEYEDEREAEEAPYQEQYSTSLRPMTERQKEEAEALARQIRPQMPNMFTDYLAENVADMIYGAGRTINGLSGGGLDYLGEKYGIDTRMNDYLSLKDEEGTGNLARNLGNMTQFGGMGLGGAALFTSIPAAGNSIVRWNGRRNLINQLKRGEDFKDINFGKVYPDTLKRINRLREFDNQPRLNQNAYIPANVVRKFYNKRLKEGYTPEDMARMGKRLFHEGGNTVSESKYPHIQQIGRPRTYTEDVGYISQNPANGQTVIKSMYKIDKGRKGI